MPSSKSQGKTWDVSLAPLADFFWIAGLDSSELLEKYIQLGEASRLNGIHSPGLEDTIEEDELAEAEGEAADGSPRPTSRHSGHNSLNRLSRLSNEAAFSVQQLDSNRSGTASNRSSATIRPVRTSSKVQSGSFNDDMTFDDALRRFAADRESFFLDLNLSAGAVTTSTNKPRPRPRTQKIVADDQTNNGLKSSIGSVRRHISVRGMNSMKRQSSVMSRQGKFRLHIVL
ncbi:MAG: hypothetical protein Q9227_000781 [Pyrenula ochraceoflavens]